jgi:hypothetical protein
MQPEGSLWCTQEPTIKPYPEQTESYPRLNTLILQETFISTLPPISSLRRALLLHGFTSKICLYFS